MSNNTVTLPENNSHLLLTVDCANAGCTKCQEDVMLNEWLAEIYEREQQTTRDYYNSTDGSGFCHCEETGHVCSICV